MKGKDYLKMIEKVVKKHPELDVVFAHDNEGNGFSKVHFSPSVGIFKNGDYENKDKDPNAICIN